MRSIPLILLAGFAVPGLVGCSGSAPATREVELTTTHWEPTAPAPDAPYSPAEPLDPRRITMAPERHLEQERLCDLSFVGELHEVGVRSDYPLPVSHRVSIRCRASNEGEGWADLVFEKSSASLATYVEPGERIRVRVVAVEGFERHPVVAFVASIGEIPLAPARWEYQTVGTGERFDEAWEGTRACAVVHQGAVRPIEGAPYPSDASHHAIVTCRHDRGETLIDLAFPADKQLAALRVRRGEVIPIRRGADEGEAELAIGVYAGP